MCLLDLNTKLKPFNDNVVYDINELAFFSFDCDNGMIMECSNGFAQLMSVDGGDCQSAFYNFRDRCLSIDDLFEGINYNERKFNLLQTVHSISKNSIEGYFKMSLEDFIEDLDTRAQRESNMILAKKFKTAIYIEELGAQRVQVGFIVVSVADKNYLGFQSSDF